jgi:hypothetical protein
LQVFSILGAPLFSMIHIISVALLILSSHEAFAASHNATVSGDGAKCSCAIEKESDGKCPAKTFGAADGITMLWQDSKGTRRNPTANGCCQITSDKMISKKENICSPDVYVCPELSVNGVTSKNPITCTTDKLSNGFFACACATKAELESAVDNLITYVIIGVICGIIVVVYVLHWFCWAKNGVCMDCCRPSKHCFGYGCCWLYYIICCPCRLCWCACYGKESLTKKEAPYDGSSKDNSAGAPTVLEMIA